MKVCSAQETPGPMAREINSEYLLVVDLEGTCDDGRLPRQERETIEIGAVLVRADSLETLSEFQSFVRPVRHPDLSDYCVELTGITQNMVDAAPPFNDAFTSFREAMLDGRDVVFASWGGYDLRQLQRDCDFHGVENPIERGIDLSMIFTRQFGLARRPSMKHALELVGLNSVGNYHRGIDDARNLARLLPWALGRTNSSKDPISN